MQRIVVDKDKDIFDYVVDFAIKQHNQPEEGFDYSQYWNIAKNDYYIKFCGANGRAYRAFKAKFNREPDKIYPADVLRWKKDNFNIEMSISYYGQKWNHVRKKRRYLLVNYIVVNGEQVYKCRPCANPPEPDRRYWFEY